MKFRIKTMLLLLTLLFGAAVNAQNIMAGASVSGPFSPVGSLNDGKIAEQDAAIAVSDPVAGKSQRLSIDLGSKFYIKQIKIYWDIIGVPQNFDIWLSKSGVDNEVLKDFKGSDAVKKDKYYIQEVQLDTALAQYVTIFIPPGVAINRGKQVRIREIEIIRELDPKITIKNVRYFTTDKEIIVLFDTNIDAQNQVNYALDDWEAKEFAPLRNLFSGTRHSRIIYGLKPETKYRFKVSAFSSQVAKEAETEFYHVETKKRNLAYKQPVIGTFTNFPDDKLVKKEVPALDRITDGSNDYFASLAQSGSVPKGEQFFIVDLWKTYSVNELFLNWWAVSYPKAYDVYISTDAKRWEIVDSGRDASNGLYTYTGLPIYIDIVKVGVKQARYVKIVIPQKSAVYNSQSLWDFVSVFEIKIF